MSVVYGRAIEGQETTFGTTGYTYNDTFVLYDRSTRSVWYPFGDGAMTAVSGDRKGRRLPYLANPQVIPLGQWRSLHPDTLVLLGDRRDVARMAGRTSDPPSQSPPASPAPPGQS